MGKLLHTVALMLALYTVVAARNAGDDEKFKKDVQSCQLQSQATEDEMQLMARFEEQATSSGKCFVGCMFEKYGILVDGVFSKKNAEKWIAKRFAGKKEQGQKAMLFVDHCEVEVGMAPQERCSTGPVLQRCIKGILQQLMAKKN